MSAPVLPHSEAVRHLIAEDQAAELHLDIDDDRLRALALRAVFSRKDRRRHRRFARRLALRLLARRLAKAVGA